MPRSTGFRVDLPAACSSVWQRFFKANSLINSMRRQGSCQDNAEGGDAIEMPMTPTTARMHSPVAFEMRYFKRLESVGNSRSDPPHC